MLLEKKAGLDFADKNGRTALDIAEKAGQMAVVDLIRSHMQRRCALRVVAWIWDILFSATHVLRDWFSRHTLTESPVLLEL